MTKPGQTFVSLRLPPLHAPFDAHPRLHRRPPAGADLSRLGRLVACLVALALPAFGIAAADTVHRVATPTAKQAAASGSPSHDAAALDGVSRAGSPVRETLRLTALREMRR